MTTEELAWVAGLFEGEGAIMIIRRSRAGQARHGLYTLVCSVQMTDPQPVRLLHSWFGGSLTVQRRRGNARHTLNWRASARAAAAFLGQIRPYLQSERVIEKADLAIAFQARKRLGRPPTGYMEEQAMFWQRLRALNRRGVDAEISIELPPAAPRVDQLILE